MLDEAIRLSRSVRLSSAAEIASVMSSTSMSQNLDICAVNLLELSTPDPFGVHRPGFPMFRAVGAIRMNPTLRISVAVRPGTLHRAESVSSGIESVLHARNPQIVRIRPCEEQRPLWSFC
jgi:hypothetical protein